MKYFILFICLNLLYINSEYITDSKFNRNPIYYEKLIQAANETFFQLFDLTVDFKNRTEVILEDESKLLAIFIDDNDPIKPENYENVTFDVIDGKPIISDILDLFSDELIKKNYYMKAFGLKLDIKENFKILANMVASGFNDGTVFIYKKNFTEKMFQIRYKCFIKEKESDKYIGAFEIIQQDKDKGDCEKILKAIKDWWKLVSPLVKGHELEIIANVVTSIQGIWKSSSLFLKNSYIILVLLLFI